MAQIFPTAEKEVAADTVLSLVNKPVDDNVYKLASKAAQVQHSLIKKMLSAIVDNGHPQTETAYVDNTMAQVMDRFQFFARFEVPSSALIPSKTVTGSDALEKIYGVAVAKKNNGEAILLADVWQLDTFEFLVTDAAETKKYAAVCKEARASTQGATLKKSAKKASVKVINKDKSVSEAAAMFS